MSLKPYTIVYHDRQHNRREFCCYAFDSWHARCEAIDLVQDVHDNANCIVHIIQEDKPFDW